MVMLEAVIVPSSLCLLVKRSQGVAGRHSAKALVNMQHFVPFMMQPSKKGSVATDVESLCTRHCACQCSKCGEDLPMQASWTLVFDQLEA